MTESAINLGKSYQEAFVFGTQRNDVDDENISDMCLFEFLQKYYFDHSDFCDDDYVTLRHEQNETKLMKKRKKSYNRVNPLPRILKRDLRRDYGSMLINTYNSANPDQVSAYFRLFAVPNCTFVGYYPAAARVGCSNLRSARTVQGVIDSINHDVGLIPDFTLRIMRTEILQRQGIPGCKIIIECTMKGTICYEDDLRISPESIHAQSSSQWDEQLRDCIHQDCWVSHYYGTPPSPFVQQKTISTTTSTATAVYAHPPLHRKYCRICMQSVRRFHSRPMVIQSRPVLVLTLDERHRICSFEVDVTPL